MATMFILILKYIGTQMRFLAVTIISLLLAACGGGGGGGGGGGSSSGGGGSTSAGNAEGLWSGTTSTGYALSLLVLEDGTTWGLYGAGNTIWGSIYGTSTASGSSFSASGTAFSFYSRTASSTTLTGLVYPGSSLNIQASSGGTGSLIYNTSYNTPATLAAIAGNYTGWSVTKSTLAQSVTFSIAGNGAITSSYTNCSVSGSVTPRASGKNVYNVTTTFTGSACALGNGVTTTGVAVLDASSGSSRLYVSTLNASQTDGFVLNALPSGTAGGTATVPAQAAFINWTKAASSNKFNVYVTNGCLGTFSTTKAAAVASSTILGAGYSYVTNTDLTFSNCTPSTSSGNESVWLDSNYLPINYLISSGSPVNDAYYGQYASTPNIPASLTAGASGTVGTQNLYTNGSMTTSAGRADITYTSSVETSTSLLLNLVRKTYDASNVLSYTEIDTYRVTTSGIATLLSIEINYANGRSAYFR